MCLERQSFFVPSPSLSSCEYMEAFLLDTRLPCLFVCLPCLDIHTSLLEFPPARLSIMSTHPATATRRLRALSVHIAGDLNGAPGADAKRRVDRSRASESAEDPAKRIPPKTAHRHQHRVRFTAVCHPDREINYAVQMSLFVSAHDVGVEKSLRRLASSHDGGMRRQRPTTNRCNRAQT